MSATDMNHATLGNQTLPELLGIVVKVKHVSALELFPKKLTNGGRARVVLPTTHALGPDHPRLGVHRLLLRRFGKSGDGHGMRAITTVGRVIIIKSASE